MQRSATSSAAWGLGLAACFCNLMIVLLPIGLVLGGVSLTLSLLGRARRTDERGRMAGLALSGVSFLIAAIWALTIAAVFVLDPTL